MKRHKKVKNKKPKISEMVLKISEGFLSTEMDLDQKNNQLRIACVAWNIACFQGQKRHDLIDEYVAAYKEMNNASDEICKDLKDNMVQLIEAKDRLYPDVLKQILDAKIESIDGKDHVQVTTTAM